jgi:hypothetical protein
MSKHTVICDLCDRSMVELYQVHGTGVQPPTLIMHCLECAGVIAVQKVTSSGKQIQAAVHVEDGGRVRPPIPAPDQIEIVRETLDPEKLRARILGQGGYFR